MNHRLLSLDVFRGMTIFFMIVVNTPGSWSYVYAPLLHAKWNGCTPTDLVFPFFMFIVGVSMAISHKQYEEKDNSIWIKKAVSRGTKIIFIGVLLNWFPFFTISLSELRIFGVLQRIGLSFLIAGIIIAYAHTKYLWWIISGLLIGYWIILLSDGVEGLSLEGNLVRTLDIYLFGESHIYKGYGIPFDPEGLLSTIPAIGTVLLGFIVGLKIRETPNNIFDNISWLLKAGSGFVVLGLIWSFIGFPINKPIWSSSYVLYTAGLAMITIALLIWLIDVKNIKRWSYVFNAFGKNPLISYILSGVLVKTSLLINIGDMNLYQWLYVNIYQLIFGNYLGSFLFAMSVVMLIWVIAWWMDRRGIIIKV
jgi:predicted acyltransferase